MFNDTKPRTSMSRLTFFVSLACLLLTGVPVSNGSRHPITACCYCGLRLKIRMTYQLHSQAHLFIGFEASASLARNSPYRIVGRSHSTDKGSHILLGQFVRHVSRLQPSRISGSRFCSCNSWVGESAGETIGSR